MPLPALSKAFKFITSSRPFVGVAVPGPGRRWLLGYGMCWHESDNRPVAKDDSITKSEAKIWLANQIDRYSSAIQDGIPFHLNDNEMAALMSLAIEFGYDWLNKSEIMWSLRHGNKLQTVAEIEVASFTAVKFFKKPVIVNQERRKLEREMFEGLLL